MRPEDLGKLFEDAFDKITPQDEAHREKLERMRASIRELNEVTARSFRDAQALIKRVADSGEDMAKVRRLSDESRQETKALRGQVAAIFDEHADLFDSFVGRFPGR